MIAVIGDPDTATGFRLAGVGDVYEPESSIEGGWTTVQLLDKLSREEVALIILSERLATETKVREKIKEINEKKRGVIPIIVTVPDKKGPMVTEADEIGILIKRAVGVAVK
ncbi:V/A-type H+-transporting ATPase subunit F [Candidatus Methanophagaceae archaeon]|nr:V/A-type H+-transporting ATPase subunit F [Methanophagales archaeon]